MMTAQYALEMNESKFVLHHSHRRVNVTTVWFKQLKTPMDGWFQPPHRAPLPTSPLYFLESRIKMNFCPGTYAYEIYPGVSAVLVGTDRTMKPPDAAFPHHR